MDWPKCEYPGCVNGKIEHRMGGVQDCPACHGSGERDLTADEAAEYLTELGYKWEQAYNGELWYITVYDIATDGNEFSEQVRARKYTAALNAAARAVRKEMG